MNQKQRDEITTLLRKFIEKKPLYEQDLLNCVSSIGTAFKLDEKKISTVIARLQGPESWARHLAKYICIDGDIYKDKEGRE